MQRKSVRAEVLGADVDVPIELFVDNQFVIFQDGVLTCERAAHIVGTPVAGNLALWYDSETVGDSGISALNTVTNPGTSVTNQLATFADNTGKVIQAVSVTAVGGAVANVSTINTINPTTWVVGPASAVSGNLPSFNGTTGKLIQDSGVAVANIATAPGTGTADRLTTFTGTGKAIQATSVTVIAGVITNVTTINGRNPASLTDGAASAIVGNVAVFNSTSGKSIADSGIASADLVTNSGAGVSGNVPMYTGTSPVLQNSGVAAANIVTNTTTNAANRVATFTGTGRPIQSATVTISGGTVAGVATINTIDPATWVVGPASATSGRVASYNGTTGKLIQDSGVVAANITTSLNNAAAAGELAYFTTAGSKQVNPANSIVINPATGAINGIKIDDHATGHLPGGVDPIFADGSSYPWADWDMPAADNSSGLGFYPRYMYGRVCSAQSVGSSAITPAGATVTIPNRGSGEFCVEWDFIIGISDSTGNIEISVVVSSGGCVAGVSIGGGAGLISSSGDVVSFSIATAPPTLALRVFLGWTVPSANATAAITFRKSSGSNFLVVSNGIVRCLQSRF